MKTTVTHICGHSREVPTSGVRNARQTKRWMAETLCPSCREREQLLAQPRLGPYTTEQLAALVGLK